MVHRGGLGRSRDAQGCMKWDDGSQPSSTANGLTWPEPIIGKYANGQHSGKKRIFSDNMHCNKHKRHEDCNSKLQGGAHLPVLAFGVASLHRRSLPRRCSGNGGGWRASLGS